MWCNQLHDTMQSTSRQWTFFLRSWVILNFTQEPAWNFFLSYQLHWLFHFLWIFISSQEFYHLLLFAFNLLLPIDYIVDKKSIHRVPVSRGRDEWPSKCNMLMGRGRDEWPSKRNMLMGRGRDEWPSKRNLLIGRGSDEWPYKRNMLMGTGSAKWL